MLRKDISRLKGQRMINFNIGLVAAVLCCILAFNWTSGPSTLSADLHEPEASSEVDIQMVRTPASQKKIPPPPVISVIAEKETFEQVAFIEPQPTFVSTSIETVTTDDPPDFPGSKIQVPAIPLPIEDDTEKAPPFFKIVEDMPFFGDCIDSGLSKKERKNCSDRALLTFLSKNIRYPVIARENNIQGMVYMKFIVGADGSISDAEIVRDIGGGCGEEALRVIKAMPDWQAGMQRKRKVKVLINLPVRFRLE